MFLAKSNPTRDSHSLEIRETTHVTELLRQFVKEPLSNPQLAWCGPSDPAGTSPTAALQLWRAIQYHQITESLLGRLPDLGDAFREVRAHLHEVDSSRRRFLASADELHRILAADRISAISLGDLSIGLRYWGDAELREVNSLELLVQKPMVELACQRLSEHGYREHPDATRFRRRELRLQGRRTLVRDVDTLNLRWSFPGLPERSMDDLGVWQRSKSLRDGHQKRLVLSLEDDLVYGCLAIAGAIGRRDCRLRNVLDLFLIATQANRRVDWDRWAVRCQQQGILATVLNALEFMMLLLDCRSQLPNLERLLIKHCDQVIFLNPDEALEILRGEPSCSRQWGACVQMLNRMRALGGAQARTLASLQRSGRRLRWSGASYLRRRAA